MTTIVGTTFQMRVGGHQRAIEGDTFTARVTFAGPLSLSSDRIVNVIVTSHTPLHRPIEQGQLVHSVHASDKPGIVVWVDGVDSWVRWDSGQSTLTPTADLIHFERNPHGFRAGSSVKLNSGTDCLFGTIVKIADDGASAVVIWKTSSCKYIYKLSDLDPLFSL